MTKDDLCRPNWVMKKRAQLAWRLAEAVNHKKITVEEASAQLVEFDVEHRDRKKNDPESIKYA